MTVAAFALAFALATQAQGPPSAVTRLLDQATAREALAPETLLGELGRAGPDAVSVFVQSMQQSKWPNCARCAKGNCPHNSEARRNVTRAYLRRLSDTARKLLATKAAAQPERRSEVTSALRVLGLVGGVADLKLASDAVEAAPEVSAAAGALVEGVLQREPTALAEVARVIPRAPATTQTLMLAGLGSVPTPKSAQALVDLLGRDSRVDSVVLSQIGRIAATRRACVETSAYPKMRGYLQSPDLMTKREAALAMGRVGDGDSVSPLIELLEDASSGVRDNALWSLQKITGLRWTADAARWRRWRDTETEWWSRRAPDALARLESKNAPQVLEALREVAQHRLERNAIAKAVAPSLQRNETPVVLAACSTLATLKSVEGVPELVNLLEHANADVRNAAWGALKTITGEERPLDVNAWRAIVL